MAELTFAVRLLIAGTLIASAIPKLLAPLRFRQIVMQYAVLPPGAVGPFSRALPLVEVALAALLLTGVAIRLAATISAALFGMFAAVLMLAPDNPGGGDCGCLGRLHRHARPWVTAVDIVLATAAAFVAYDPSGTFRLYQLAGHAVPTHAALGGLVLLTLALSFVFGYHIRWRPDNREVSQWRRRFQT